MFSENEPTVYRGTIQYFNGSYLSGIASITLIDDLDTVVTIPCENAPTARALDSAFDCIQGHSIDNAKLQGHEIIYSLDDFGLLEGFTPTEDLE